MSWYCFATSYSRCRHTVMELEIEVASLRLPPAVFDGSGCRLGESTVDFKGLAFSVSNSVLSNKQNRETACSEGTR